MNELTPKLKQAAIISFNKERLEAHISAVEKKYKGMVVTEDNLSSIGKDRASINKLATEIKKAFTSTKKQLLEPLSELDESVKSGVQRLDALYRSIKDQEDDFEVKRREQAKIGLEAIRQQILADNHVNDKYDHLVEIKDSYLNKTADQVKTLDDLTDQAKQAYKLQKADADAAKIKEEKTKMIAEYCQIYSAKFELNKPLESINFNRLIESDIDTMQEAIADAAHIQSQKEKKIASAKKETAITGEQAVTEREQVKAPVEPIKQVEALSALDIRIHATSLQRIALTDFMRDSGIKFELLRKAA